MRCDLAQDGDHVNIVMREVLEHRALYADCSYSRSCSTTSSTVPAIGGLPGTRSRRLDFGVGSPDDAADHHRVAERVASCFARGLVETCLRSRLGHGRENGVVLVRPSHGGADGARPRAPADDDRRARLAPASATSRASVHWWTITSSWRSSSSSRSRVVLKSKPYVSCSASNHPRRFPARRGRSRCGRR